MTVIILASRTSLIKIGVFDGYQKIENGVVEGYKKIENRFVGKYLVREGESVEEAKMRLAKEREKRVEQAKECKNIHVEIPDLLSK